MAKQFYDRLSSYFVDVSKVLSGQSDSASIFPNTSDIGDTREEIYRIFLKQHLPARCNIFKGGFLFHVDGSESEQLDIIVSNSVAPQFNFHNSEGQGKSFSTVEGCLGVVSCKSTLDKKELYSALKNIASIPPTESIEGRIPPETYLKYYDAWPYKVVFATDGVACETLKKHINEFYTINPDIPLSRRPDIIHVAGKYVIQLATEMVQPIGASGEVELGYSIGDYLYQEYEPDITALSAVMLTLQRNALISTDILYDYSPIFNTMLQHVALKDSSA